MHKARTHGVQPPATWYVTDGKCPVCQRLREPSNPAHLPGRIRRYKDFGECVAIDLFELADIRGERRGFLNCLDMASGFQIVTPLPGLSPPAGD